MIAKTQTRGARVRALVIVAAAMLWTAAAASAQSNDSGLRLRVWSGVAGRYLVKDNDTFPNPPFGTTAMKVDGLAPAWGADAEWKLNKWVGVDAALATTDVTVDFNSSVAAATVQQQKFRVTPWLFSLNVHLVSTSVVDVWVGPQLGYFMYRDTLFFPVGSAGTFSYAPSNTFSKKGFTAGTDITLTKRFGLNGQFRYQDGDGDPDGQLTIDPTFVVGGLTIKW